MPLQVPEPGPHPPTWQPLDEGCGSLPIKASTSTSTVALKNYILFLIEYKVLGIKSQPHNMSEDKSLLEI